MTFRASNGSMVELEEGGWVKVDGAGYFEYIDRRGVEALREFFQHERDEELGRWRYPEDPDLVVYLQGQHLVVFSEGAGVYEEFQVAWARVSSDEPPLTIWQRAAVAWADTHPERKPWHDAKAGEVWALTIEGGEFACLVTQSGPDFEPIGGHPLWATIARGSARIADARKLWPES